MSASRQLVVSVHDVAPPSRARVERILRMLTDVGVARRSLLVIPNLQGRFPIDEHADFCAWLHRCRENGDEIVLHGCEHVGVGTPRTAAERFRNRWFTDGEGEFLTLDYDAALDRLVRGAATMHRAGFDPVGFVAPAWLISGAGLRAVRDFGFEYTNSYFAFADLTSRRSHVAPSLVFGPGRLDEDLGLALQRRMAPLLGLSKVVRVALHPPCVEHASRMASVVSLIDRQRRDREPITYRELLGELRRSLADVAQGRHAH